MINAIKFHSLISIREKSNKNHIRSIYFWNLLMPVLKDLFESNSVISEMWAHIKKNGGFTKNLQKNCREQRHLNHKTFKIQQFYFILKAFRGFGLLHFANVCNKKERYWGRISGKDKDFLKKRTFLENNDRIF